MPNDFGADDAGRDESREGESVRFNQGRDLPTPDIGEAPGRPPADARASDEKPLPSIVSGYVPGLIGAVVGMHATYYARTSGFGAAFEQKVAAGLAVFAGRLANPVNGIWHASAHGDIAASIAIDGEDLGGGLAHLRWFIVSDKLRGRGVGARLLDQALAHCDQHGFRETHLWTFRGLDTARALYERCGFVLTEEQPGRQWGTEVQEQRFIRRRPSEPIT